MKEYTEIIDWLKVWGFSKQFILPNIGSFLFWTVLFVLLGLILGIVLNIILYRKTFLTETENITTG